MCALCPDPYKHTYLTLKEAKWTLQYASGNCLKLNQFLANFIVESEKQHG